MAKSVDAADSKSAVERRVGSSPTPGTIRFQNKRPSSRMAFCFAAHALVSRYSERSAAAPLSDRRGWAPSCATAGVKPGDPDAVATYDLPRPFSPHGAQNTSALFMAPAFSFVSQMPWRGAQAPCRPVHGMPLSHPGAGVRRCTAEVRIPTRRGASCSNMVRCRWRLMITN